ncbi:hypothetical protein BDV3_002035 [Batrachochytrium dendrobatidis]
MPRLGTAGVNPTTSSDQILAPILDNAAIKKGKLSIFSNSRNLALQKQKTTKNAELKTLPSHNPPILTQTPSSSSLTHRLKSRFSQIKASAIAVSKRPKSDNAIGSDVDSSTTDKNLPSDSENRLSRQNSLESKSTHSISSSVLSNQFIGADTLSKLNSQQSNTKLSKHAHLTKVVEGESTSHHKHSQVLSKLFDRDQTKLPGHLEPPIRHASLDSIGSQSQTSKSISSINLVSKDSVYTHKDSLYEQTQNDIQKAVPCIPDTTTTQDSEDKKLDVGNIAEKNFKLDIQTELPFKSSPLVWFKEPPHSSQSTKNEAKVDAKSSLPQKKSALQQYCKTIVHILRRNEKHHDKKFTNENLDKQTKVTSTSSLHTVDQSQSGITDSSNPCISSLDSLSATDDVDEASLQQPDDPRVISSRLQKPDSDVGESSKNNLTKKVIKYFRGNQLNHHNDRTGQFMLDENTDDPDLQAALAIIRDYMIASSEQEPSLQLKTYQDLVKKVYKLVKSAKKRIKSTVKHVGTSHGWANSGPIKNDLISDPGINLFVESVEKRLEQEEFFHQTLAVHRAGVSAYTVEIEPVRVPKYGGMLEQRIFDSKVNAGIPTSIKTNAFEKQTSEKLKGRYCDIDNGEDDAVSLRNDDDDDTNDVVYGTSKYRVIDLIKSKDLTFDDLMLDAKRVSQNVLAGQSESTLAYTSSRGSLAIPISEGQRSSKSYYQLSLERKKSLNSNNRLNSASMFLKAFPSCDRICNQPTKFSSAVMDCEKTTLDFDSTLPAVKPPKHAHTDDKEPESKITQPNANSASSFTKSPSRFVLEPAGNQPGIDVDNLLTRILGDDDFKRTLVGPHLFNREAHPNLFGEESGAPLMSEHDQFYSHKNDMSSHVDESDADNESICSFVDRGPTWRDFKHFSQKLEPSYEDENVASGLDRVGLIDYDSDEDDVMQSHPLQRSNSESCDLFELELLFEQHRKRNRAAYKSGHSDFSSNLKPNGQSFDQTAPAVQLGPAQLGAAHL